MLWQMHHFEVSLPEDDDALIVKQVGDLVPDGECHAECQNRDCDSCVDGCDGCREGCHSTCWRWKPGNFHAGRIAALALAKASK